MFKIYLKQLPLGETKLTILLMQKIIFAVFISLFLLACDSKRVEVDVSDIKETVKIKRYELALFEANIDYLQRDLDKIAPEFPVFIAGDYKNPEKIKGLMEYILNPLNQLLYQECIKVFANFDSTQLEIEQGFKHYSYHYPDKKLPTIYTYISSLNFEEPIVATDSFVVVAIDLFLGQNFKEYKNFGVPLFVSKRFDKRYLPSELMRNLALHQYGKNLNGESLLEYMISLGKVEYFVWSMYPDAEDSLRFAFTPGQMEWCEKKQKAFWEYLGSEKMLFSKDYQEFKKYIEDRPFVTSLEKESPGRAGVWIGFNIVKQYMEKHPEVSLHQLMVHPKPMDIFKESKYKP